MDTNAQANINLETLTCPITLQIFHDPVTAKDGHVYERAAIVKWIEKHGTSPLTREPLNVADLQEDEHLKYLAAQRRSSTVSYMAQDGSVTLPITYRNNSESTIPTNNVSNTGRFSSLKKLNRYVWLCCIAFLIITVFISIIIGFTVRNKLDNKTNQTTPSSLQVSYSWQFTINSSTSDHNYKAFQLISPKSGYFRISIQSNVNVYAYLYNDYLLLKNPWPNQILFNHINICSSQLGISVNLLSEHVYTLVVIICDIFINETFSITIIGPDYVRLVSINTL